MFSIRVDTSAVSFWMGFHGMLHERQATRMLETNNYINNTSNITIQMCEKPASISIRFPCGFQAMLKFKITSTRESL